MVLHDHSLLMTNLPPQHSREVALLHVRVHIPNAKRDECVRLVSPLSQVHSRLQITTATHMPCDGTPCGVAD